MTWSDHLDSVDSGKLIKGFVGLLPGPILFAVFRNSFRPFLPEPFKSDDFYFLSLLAILVVLAALIGAYFLKVYFRRRWRKRLLQIDVADGRLSNKNVPANLYHPVKILARPRITKLDALGNGCSKWSMSAPDETLRNQFNKHSAAGAEMRFLVSCPTYLLDQANNTSKDTPEKSKLAKKLEKKAIRNAQNICKLLEFIGSNKKFKLRTYDNEATIRLVIVDGEVALGHYSVPDEDDSDFPDSEKSPLLILSGQNENGFIGGFKAFYEQLWDTGHDITNRRSEIVRISQLTS